MFFTNIALMILVAASLIAHVRSSGLGLGFLCVGLCPDVKSDCYSNCIGQNECSEACKCKSSECTMPGDDKACFNPCFRKKFAWKFTKWYKCTAKCTCKNNLACLSSCGISKMVYDNVKNASLIVKWTPSNWGYNYIHNFKNKRFEKVCFWAGGSGICDDCKKTLGCRDTATICGAKTIAEALQQKTTLTKNYVACREKRYVKKNIDLLESLIDFKDPAYKLIVDMIPEIQICARDIFRKFVSDNKIIPEAIDPVKFSATCLNAYV